MRHSVRMSIEETRSGTPSWRLPALVASVIVTALALTWTYLGMRAVMDVGGSCADGGQVVSWIVCGVVFWLMAAPALFLMTRFDYNKDSFDGVAKVQSRGRGLWWAIYAALAVVGVALGAWSFDSWT